MKSRLLPRQVLDALSLAANVQALVATLAKTPYRRPLEAALVYLTGRDAVLRAVRADLEVSLTRIRRFFQGDTAMPVAIVLRSYDVRNLKAILRGLNSRTPPDEIDDALLPVGDLSGSLLAELAQAADPRVAIDLLASMALPFAVPLLRLRGARPGASIAEMELHLDRWYFQHAFTALGDARDETLLHALWLEADLINIQTVLRLAATPQAQETVLEQLGVASLAALFVGPGRLSPSLLESAARQNMVPEAVALFEPTIYAAPLAAGLDDYRRNGRLSSFERQLNRFRLRRLAALIVRHPLGSGVLLGYLALKTNEVNNLRWITNGIFLSLSADQIRAELVYPS